MLVSSVGYLYGYANGYVRPELSMVQVKSDIVNKGSNMEDKTQKYPLVQNVSDVFRAFFDPNVKNAKRALDMIV